VPTETPPKKRPRRLWQWLKRLLLVGVLLLVVLGFFHRPLIFALVRWIAPKAAAAQGLPLEWQITGSLWSGLEISAVKTGGGDSHWLPRATLGAFNVSYDLPAVLRRDYEHSVTAITLHDADVALDLRHLPQSSAQPDELKKTASSGTAPPLVWPRTIDLKNLSATVTLADGRRIVVRGLTLQIGEGMPGIFECKELRIEPDGPNLEQVSAQVAWEPRKITIRNLTLPKEVVLEELVLDLTRFSETNAVSAVGVAAVQATARLGPARLAFNAIASGLFHPPMNVEAAVQATDLRADELHTLGLPRSIQFQKGSLQVKAAGDPLKSQQLQIGVDMSLADIRTEGARVDQIALAATLHEGRAELKSAKVTRGANVIEASAEAALPADLKDWPQTRWTAKASATLPDATQFFDKAPAAKGSISLNLTAEGAGPTPTKVSGELTGDTLAFEDYRLPRLRTLLALDGKEARLEIPLLELGTGNQLSVKAAMQMQDTMPVKAEWSASITSPAELMRATGVKPPPQPVSGILETAGSAAFTVGDLSAGRLDSLIASLKLDLRNGRHGDSPLPVIAFEAHAREGRAVLKPCTIRFDAENHLDLDASVALAAPHAFQATGDIALPSLTALNTLLESFGAPPIQSGSIFSKLEARGQLQPWQCQGGASLTAAKVKTAAMPEAADATLEATFAGTRADLSRLEATLGPWRLGVKGAVDDKAAHLAELNLWQKNTLLLRGHAHAPFDVMKPDVADVMPVDVALTAKDLRLHEILAAAGIKGIPPGILNADISLTGRLDNASGRVRVNLREVKAPGMPKSFTAAMLDLDTTLQNNQVKSLIKLTQPPLQTLTVEAALPLDAAAVVKAPGTINDTPLKVSVRMPESDLAFLREYAPDMVKSLPAKMKLDADIAGTVAKPLVKAALDLDVSEVVWSKPDMPSLRDVRVRLRAQDRRLSIEDVSALLAGGRVKLGGTVEAADPQKPTFDLKLTAGEALVFRDPTTSLRANADITCTGGLQSARVAGLVETVRGRVFKEIDLMPMLRLPADVPPVPEDTQRSEARLTLPPLLKEWTFDVRVKTRDPLLISGNLANGAVSADVLLSGTGAEPRLTGGANVDRLLLKLPFSVVKITKGVITMNPQKPFDPALDIRGESHMGSNDITLYIYGDSTNPKTRFTSTPPMSEPDIVTLLATGTTLGGSTDQLASEAASRAAFLFLSELYRKTFNKKKVVREEPPKLHMTFNPSGADRSNDSVQAAYDLTDNWRVTGRFTQVGRMKLLLGYVLHFGKAAQAVDEKP